jgi:hypothetical protein
MQLKRDCKILIRIQQIQGVKGYIPKNIVNYRNMISKDLLKLVKTKQGRNI